MAQVNVAPAAAIGRGAGASRSTMRTTSLILPSLLPSSPIVLERAGKPAGNPRTSGIWNERVQVITPSRGTSDPV
eukprot:gene12560-15782_t